MARHIPVILLLLLVAGCSKKAETLPLGQELSTVPQVSIRRKSASTWQSSIHHVAGELKAVERPLLEVLWWARSTGHWIYDEAPLPEGLYDVSVQWDPQQEDCWALLVEAYERAFKVQIRRETREVDALIMHPIPVRPAALVPSKPDQRYGLATRSGGWVFEACSMEDVAEWLEDRLDMPVLNNTGLEGTYNFKLATDVFQPEALLDDLRALGIIVSKEKREMEVVVVKRGA